MQTESLKNTALERISRIIDHIFEESEIYKEEIDKTKFMEHLSDRLNNSLSPEKVTAISEERLTRIVKQHMAIDVLGGLLSDLTPEELEIFDAAVEGR